MRINEHIEKEIWEYLDDTMSSVQKANFESRLARDNELKKAFESLKGFDLTLESQIVHTAPKGLRASVLKKINYEESSINQSLKVLVAVLIFIGLASGLGAFIAFDRLDINESFLTTFTDSISWMASPVIASLTGVLLLALMTEVYLLRPKTPK